MGRKLKKDWEPTLVLPDEGILVEQSIGRRRLYSLDGNYVKVYYEKQRNVVVKASNGYTAALPSPVKYWDGPKTRELRPNEATLVSALIDHYCIAEEKPTRPVDRAICRDEDCTMCRLAKSRRK